MVGFPHEHPVGVVVLTWAARPERHLPGVDAAIGELARLATGPLRMPDDVTGSGQPTAQDGGQQDSPGASP